MSGILCLIVGNSYGPPPIPIGSAYGGGFFAGQISTAGNGIADYNLVIGPVSSAQNSSIQVKTTATATTGTSSDIDGPTNSANMNNASNPAAQFCEGLTIGGFSDWYMPAKNELEVCYFNLKPTTQNNNTSTGANPNAVPSRGSNYTTSDPLQTSATAFQDSGAQAFAAADYWSSTEFTINPVANRKQGFGVGLQGAGGKTDFEYVRAVRRVPV